MPFADYDDVLDALVRLRKARDWTQEGLAKRLGVRQSTVGNWEAGISKPPVPQLIKILKVLGYGLDVVPEDTPTGTLALAAEGLGSDDVALLILLARALQADDANPVLLDAARQILQQAATAPTP